MNERKALARSAQQPLPGSVSLASVFPTETLRVNVYVRRRPDGPPFPDTSALGAQPPRKREYLTREQFEERYGASQEDVDRVTAFAQQFGLGVVETSLARRTITIEGTAAAFSAAFAVSLGWYAHASGIYRTHEGAIQVPEDLAEVVIGVIGFDERLAATPSAAVHPGVFSLGQIAEAQLASLGALRNVTATRVARVQRQVLLAGGQDEAPAAEAAGAADWNAELASIVTEGYRAAWLAALDAADIKTPPGVANLYNFPPDADGSGQTIAVIELGGGYNQSDLDTYFGALGLRTPTVRNVSILGATNTPNVVQPYDVEVGLDLQVIGGAAPGATLVCYWAPATAVGFIQAVQTAIHDRENKPSVVSVSWALSEGYWLLTPMAMDVFDSILAEAPVMGVTVACASGDYGAASEFHDGRVWVDYPASNPHVLCCGGTTLISRQDQIIFEYAWNTLLTNGQATGGGVSQRFPVPPWQQNAGVPPSANMGQGFGRGCPDVSANADPITGYLVRIDGMWNVICGTSSVAPLYAALIARINQILGVNVGYINPYLYQRAAGAFHDILLGNNPVYSAGPGWDACTGLGSPDGMKLLDLLGAEGD